MDVVKRATEAVSAVAPRTSLVLKADIRPGYDDMLHTKVRRVEDALSDQASSDGPADIEA